jgi:hypothetical protein
MINYENIKEYVGNYKTPKIEKNYEIEMRSTQKINIKGKPFLNYSQLPSVFEITKLHQKKKLPALAGDISNSEKSLKTSYGSKILLKPIEIKDPRKNFNSEKYPEIKFSLEMEENFNRTSNINRANNSLKGKKKKPKFMMLEDNNLSVIVEKSEKIKFEDFLVLSYNEEINYKKVLYFPHMKIYTMRVIF